MTVIIGSIITKKYAAFKVNKLEIEKHPHTNISHTPFSLTNFNLQDCYIGHYYNKNCFLRE